MVLQKTLFKLPLLSKLPTPYYIYDQSTIVANCQRLLKMKNAYGLQIRYAVKANPNRTVLKLLRSMGIHVDASSLNEALRAVLAGYKPQEITLTSQQIVTQPTEVSKVLSLLSQGMHYTVCSIRQYEFVRQIAMKEKLRIGVRIHPGVGAGESATRNTGDKYSCFGVHLQDVQSLIERIKADGVCVDQMHIHIGSGGDVQTWLSHIVRQLQLAKVLFKDFELKRINFGGGLKVARMPDQTPAEVEIIGDMIAQQMLKFGNQTGSKPLAVLQPGTYLVADAGYVVTKVLDKKRTGEDGFNFVITDGGMEVNTRPLLYGSRHPFYIVSATGQLKSSQFDLEKLKNEKEEFVVVGRCCESGDSQSLDEHGHIVPRKMAEPEVDDLVIVGGTGAYCSSMTLINYNSHIQAPEYLCSSDGSIKIIRKPQTLEQLVQNELAQPLNL